MKKYYIIKKEISLPGEGYFKRQESNSVTKGKNIVAIIYLSRRVVCYNQSFDHSMGTAKLYIFYK